MLYICIPVHNEAETIGVLLWRIQKVFAGFPREYQILVYNDASTDATAEVLTPYTEVLPVEVLGGPERVGYARALDVLLRAVVARCRYPRRDAAIVMQGDFTDQPEHIPELVKRFEGGADIVVAEAPAGGPAPKAVQRLRRIGLWLLRRVVALPGIRDPLGSFRLFRVTVLRDAAKAADPRPLVEGEGWAANADLLLATAPQARRVETVPLPPRYDLRSRETRVRPWADALRLFHAARAMRARRRPRVQLAGR